MKTKKIKFWFDMKACVYSEQIQILQMVAIIKVYH